MVDIFARIQDEILLRRSFRQKSGLSAESIADKLQRLAHAPRPGWLTRSITLTHLNRNASTDTLQLKLCARRHLDHLRLPVAGMTLTLDTDPHSGDTRIRACVGLHPLLMLLVLAGLMLPALRLPVGLPSLVIAGGLLLVWLRAYADRNILLQQAQQSVRDREREALHHLRARPNLDTLPRYVRYTEPGQWSLKDDPRKSHRLR
jgi:hypothetical protein